LKSTVQIKSTGESLIDQSYKINKECRVTLAETTKIAANKVVPLKLKDVAGAFVILALGSALSFIILFVECILKKIKTK
jgi:hypothetical protein